MSITRCHHCGRPFYQHRRRCPHCGIPREDLGDEGNPLRLPVSLLLLAVAISGLMLLWSLLDNKPLYATPPPDETPRMATRPAPDP